MTNKIKIQKDLEDVNLYNDRILNFIEDLQNNKEDDSDKIEPNVYFEQLKSNLSKTEEADLLSRLNVLKNALDNAKANGQDKLVQTIYFNMDCIIREIKALAIGVDSYVEIEALRTLIDKVKPRNSIKIIEIERYPRIIPDHVSARLQEVKSKNLFDKFCVVFTDYTENTYATEEEKKIQNRNKDPIIFGYFEDKKDLQKSDRFYFIADWVDEYCDLTFTKLVDLMAEHKVAEISVGNLKDLEKQIIQNRVKQEKDNQISKKPLSLIERIKLWLFGKA